MIRALALALCLTTAAAAQDVYGLQKTAPGISITVTGPPPSAAAPASPSGPPPAAKALPEIPIGLVLGGKPDELSWAKLKGQVVLLDFFSFTCKPCLKAIPDIVKLQAQHAGKLRVVGYHVGRGSTPEVEPIVKKFGLNYPVIISPDEPNPKVAIPAGDFMAGFGAETMPSASVIGKDGTLKAWNLMPDQVAAAVAKALAE